MPAKGPIRSNELTATIMFVDIVASTGLARRHDDQHQQHLFLDFERFGSALAESEGGRFVQRTGDGTLTIFPSARAALRAAGRLRLACDESSQFGNDVHVRIGMNTGDVIVDSESDAVFGLAIHRASRISDLAEEGDILVSEATVAAAGENSGFSFSVHRVLTLRGFDDSETVHRLEAVTGERAAAARPVQRPSALEPFRLTAPGLGSTDGVHCSRAAVL